MTEFLLSGLILGLSAGMAPGPLMTLVITETLRHNLSSGLKMAMAPLFTDLPIIAATLFILSKLADSKPTLGILALMGAAFLFWMGWGNLKTRSFASATASTVDPSMLKGILANFLSPNPYLFWMAVGGAYLSRAIQHSALACAGFLFVFYLCLIGAQAGIAVFTARIKGFASQPILITIFRFLGMLLWAMAIELLWQGVTLLLNSPSSS